jgi:hypothetical protein
MNKCSPERCSAARLVASAFDCGVGHLLKIVEHQQHLPVAYYRTQCVERRLVGLLDAQGVGDCGQHLGRVTNRRQRDKINPIAKAGLPRARHMQA